MIRILRNTFALNFILLIVSSCGNSTKTDNKNTLIEKDSLATNSNDQSDKYSEAGFELIKNESLGEIKLSLDTKRIIEILGEPEEKTKAELWGADGAYHQQWKYLKKGIELDIIGELDTNLKVNMITVSEPCELKTKRNIGIGSSFEEVHTAYKTEIELSNANSEIIVARTVYGGIIFSFTDKKVKSIFIGASAE